MANLDERLAQAESIIRKPAFRQNKGLGNEVGYYIFAYDTDQELSVREMKVSSTAKATASISHPVPNWSPDSSMIFWNG